MNGAPSRLRENCVKIKGSKLIFVKLSPFGNFVPLPLAVAVQSQCVTNNTILLRGVKKKFFDFWSSPFLALLWSQRWGSWPDCRKDLLVFSLSSRNSEWCQPRIFSSPPNEIDSCTFPFPQLKITFIELATIRQKLPTFYCLRCLRLISVFSPQNNTCLSKQH